MIDITKIEEGTVIKTADKRKRTVSHTDGKYIYFKDGSQFGFRHPDLIEIIEKKPVETVSEPIEEDAPKTRKSSSKKKKSEE